jgi:hypothetical protein
MPVSDEVQVQLRYPYGIYDMTANTGSVNVGTNQNTAAFAVASTRRQWQARGRLDHPDASRLPITADARGSNSYRYRLWKAELAAYTAESSLTATSTNSRQAPPSRTRSSTSSSPTPPSTDAFTR